MHKDDKETSELEVLPGRSETYLMKIYLNPRRIHSIKKKNPSIKSRFFKKFDSSYSKRGAS